ALALEMRDTSNSSLLIQQVRMDPLSVAASVVGLVAFSTRLVKAIAESGDDFRMALSDLTGEVERLSGVLHALLPSSGDLKGSTTEALSVYLVSSSKALEAPRLSEASSLSESSNTSSPITTSNSSSSSDSGFENIRVQSTQYQLSIQLVA